MPSRRRPLLFRLVLSALAILILGGSAIAVADTRSELEDAESRLEDLRGQIASEESQLADQQQQLNELAGQIEVAESEITRTRTDIEQTKSQIVEAERRAGRLADQLEERAVEVYMQGPASNLEFLLGSSSIADLSDRLAFVEVAAQNHTDLANAVQNQLNELAATRARLAELEERQQATLDQLDARRNELAAAFEAQRQEVERLDALRSEATDLIASLEKKLKQEIAALPPPSSGGGAGDGIPGPLYACPVQGPHAYADTFGDIHVHEGWTHVHQGNDISAPEGTPIVAPFDGSAVSSSDENAGIYVTVAGGEGSVQMMHMSRLGGLGAVKTGDVVGYVGSTGNATGPHTHFEWLPGGGAAADPYPQLNEVC